MAGSRPGGPIAAAWALLNYLGEDGYLEITDIVMRTAKIFQDGINAIPGWKVLSNPEMSVFAIASDSMDVYELADELALRGWYLDRQKTTFFDFSTIGGYAVIEITIDKDVPMRRDKKRSGSKYPFEKMDIGDSFAIPIESSDPTDVQRRLSSAARRMKSQGKNFSTRTLTEGGVRVVRIWRVE